MDAFDLAILFTAAGALVGAGLVKALISAGKSLGIVPETGRGVLLANLLLSTLLIGLALWGGTQFSDGFDGADVLIIILSILNVYTAAIGVHETIAKGARIVSGDTNPAGPDPQ